jgi:hypothetical protein
MERKILIIEIAVGYMLKVMKSGRTITKFKDEFAAIRHGDYFDFINQINGPLPFMVTYKNGEVYIDDKNNSDDIDFAGLIKAGNSLKFFYEDCIDHYGEIIDIDITDSIYCKLASFEISLRMHANNNRLIMKGEKFEAIIEKIALYCHLTDTERLSLQLGRRFLNMVKHNKRHFPTWTEGIEYFLNAKKVLDIHKLTIL